MVPEQKHSQLIKYNIDCIVFFTIINANVFSYLEPFYIMDNSEGNIIYTSCAIQKTIGLDLRVWLKKESKLQNVVLGMM